MKLLFLTNNPVSASLASWLSADHDVVTISDPINAQYVDELRPDLALSYSYRHMVRSATLDVLPERFINLHISYLPFNRGADPNFWSLADRTPSGVTIHTMSPGVDEGDIIVQKKVEIVEAEHTLKSSYDLLQREIQELLKDNWKGICMGRLKAFQQPPGGSVHYAREFAEIRDLVLGPEGWDVPVRTLRERYETLGRDRVL